MKKSKSGEDQIVRILQEGRSGQVSQAELCRKHGISQNTMPPSKKADTKDPVPGMQRVNLAETVQPLDRADGLHPGRVPLPRHRRADRLAQWNLLPPRVTRTFLGK